MVDDLGAVLLKAIKDETTRIQLLGGQLKFVIEERTVELTPQQSGLIKEHARAVIDFATMRDSLQLITDTPIISVEP